MRFAVGPGVVIREPPLVATTTAYLCSSFLYSFRLKHVPLDVLQSNFGA